MNSKYFCPETIFECSNFGVAEISGVVENIGDAEIFGVAEIWVRSRKSSDDFLEIGLSIDGGASLAPIPLENWRM